MKLVKITNPLWLNDIAQEIRSFSENLNLDGITYESLMAYFQTTVQFRGRLAEFWVVFDSLKSVDESPECMAFAHWIVSGQPHLGTVYCDFIYSWVKDGKPVELLIDQFLEFGRKSNCPIYEGDAIDELRFRVFRKVASRKGYDLTTRNNVTFTGRKI